ncbi:HNH endonuclease [uncultured Jannaschia sp.]|uniref:HNH endonuclease n=1 Tax=uncultured Jannaschia sp. TaxID=293347 RepID=UPI00345C5268
MLRPYSDDGTELDARFSIEILPDGFDLIVESRGGSDGPNPARNSAYGPALVQHLVRMQACGMVLQDLQVASAVAMKMEETARRVSLDGFTLPLPLATVSDPEALRLAIGRASAAFGRSDSSGGNYTKRMRLRMQWPPAAGMTSDEIGALLARSVALAEEPTGDLGVLEARVSRVLRHIRKLAGKDTTPPPPGQAKVAKTSGSSLRFVRDPNVVAWILHQAAGLCEVCARPAPFHRADGEPYLEVHHVRPLGEGGPDTTDNAVACCPNCHRRLHHDPDHERMRDELVGAISRLTAYRRVQGV